MPGGRSSASWRRTFERRDTVLVNLKDVLAPGSGRAVGLFNTVNMELARGTIAAAEELGCPIIIGTAEVLLPYGPLEELSWLLLPMAILLVLSACFSASETAYSSASKIRLRTMHADGDVRAGPRPVGRRSNRRAAAAPARSAAQYLLGRRSNRSAAAEKKRPEPLASGRVALWRRK